MNTIDLTPLYRSSIGFDQFASMLNQAMQADKAASTYPAYNIEVLEENQYAITLAVAGFSQAEVSLEVEQGLLTVIGNKSEDSQTHDYLHQGIASRSFEHKFTLAEHVEVSEADLTNGLLTIQLRKDIPEAMKPRTIAIGMGNQQLENKPEKNQAA